MTPKTLFFDCDSIWNNLLKNARNCNDDEYYGAFVNYDDTPRRGAFGAKIVKGASPAKFEKYFSELVNISTTQNKEFIFLTAWNEWGEGAYLEPDTLNEYAYLDAIKRVMNG